VEENSMLHRARQKDYKALRVMLEIACDMEESITFNTTAKAMQYCLGTIDWVGPYPEEGEGGHFLSEKQTALHDKLCGILDKLCGDNLYTTPEYDTINDLTNEAFAILHELSALLSMEGTFE
jgi:hypothetical protein